MSKSYYEVLEVSTSATQEEIKKSYKMQARKYHPDINPSPDATSMMQEVNNAYDILSDINKRKEYDKKINKQNENKKSYESYTKTREESEQDFDDWLKEYLKARRELNKLYREYAEVVGQIYEKENLFIKPNQIEFEIKDTLRKRIKDAMNILIGVNQNPVDTLAFLFEELKAPVNYIGNCKNSFTEAKPKKVILRNLLVSEIMVTLRNFGVKNNPHYDEIITYLIKKYYETSEIINKYKRMYFYYLIDPYYPEMLNFIISLLEPYKDEISRLDNHISGSR